MIVTNLQSSTNLRVNGLISCGVGPRTPYQPTYMNDLRSTPKMGFREKKEVWGLISKRENCDTKVEVRFAPGCQIQELIVQARLGARLSASVASLGQKFRKTTGK